MDEIAKYVAEYFFGKATYVKRGRNPKFPFVPVIDHTFTGMIGVHATRTEQVKGKAYADKDSAMVYARTVIDHRRKHFEAQLRDPCHRALRRQHGFQP